MYILNSHSFHWTAAIKNHCLQQNLITKRTAIMLKEINQITIPFTTKKQPLVFSWAERSSSQGLTGLAVKTIDIEI